MMRSEPHPSSTAEKSRFSMMAVTAIHQRLAKAVAKVGAMVGGLEAAAEEGEVEWRRAQCKERERDWAPLSDAQDEDQ